MNLPAFPIPFSCRSCSSLYAPHEGLTVGSRCCGYGRRVKASHLSVLLPLVACEPAQVDTADTGSWVDLGPVSPGLIGLDELGAKNLVIIHADTLRQDRLTMSGYHRDTMPTTAQLPWVQVRQHYGSASWTFPSTASAFTGLAVESHGLTHVVPEQGANSALDVPRLPDYFREQGFHTYGGLGNVAMAQVPGFIEGFDALDEGSGSRSMNLGDLTPGSFAFLDELPKEGRFLLFFQPMDTHGPYDPRDLLGTFSDPTFEPFAVGKDVSEEEQLEAWQTAFYAARTDDERRALVDELNAVYDETVLMLDGGMASLYRGLESRKVLDDTLIVFTADHGETLGEDPLEPGFGHGGTTRTELVHLPLMFNHPRLAPEVVDCLSDNADLFPTVVQALGLPPVDGLDGQALQTGCRSFTASSVFVNNADTSELLEVTGTDGHGTYRLTCGNGIEYFYNLDIDPGAVFPLHPDDLPSAATLVAETAAFSARLSAATAAPECVAVPPEQ